MVVVVSGVVQKPIVVLLAVRQPGWLEDRDLLVLH